MTTFTQSPFHQPMHYAIWHSLLHDTIQWLHLPSHFFIDPWTMLCGIACCIASVWWHYTMTTFTQSPFHWPMHSMTTFTQSPFHWPMHYVVWHSLLHDIILWVMTTFTQSPFHWPMNYAVWHSLLHSTCLVTLYNDYIYPVTFPSTHALCHVA